MAQVLCSLPNASEFINGVVFTPVEGGMLSADIADDLALTFASINGYQLVASEEAKTKKAK